MTDLPVLISLSLSFNNKGIDDDTVFPNSLKFDGIFLTKTENNKDKVKIKKKEYQEKNKAEIKIYNAKQILCDCCGIFTISRHITRHQVTKKAYKKF